MTDEDDPLVQIVEGVVRPVPWGDDFSETPVKADFVARMRETLPGWVVIRHEDKTGGGTPDISLTGPPGTGWLEAKVAKGGGDPDNRGRGAQSLQMLRLHGIARNAAYVVWREDAAGDRWTEIALPRRPMDWHAYEARYPGFDHDSAIKWMVMYLFRRRQNG